MYFKKNPNNKKQIKNTRSEQMLPFYAYEAKKSEGPAMSNPCSVSHRGAAEGHSKVKQWC